MRIQKRRRRECKTDYKLRLGLLKSADVRIVVRKTNKHIIAQVVKSKEAQDKVLFGVSSKDLLKNGWDEKFKGSLKSVPAAYLTGLMLAKKIEKGNYILDSGMIRTQSGNRIYAVVNGLVDGGVKIKADKKMFPSEDRAMGKHLSEDVQKIIVKVREKLKW